MMLTKLITKSFLKNAITNACARSEENVEIVDAEGDSESVPESSSEDDNT
jgi:hypothetical protein